MRKFAPVTMLVALITSLLLGGAAAAQASPGLSFDCVQKVGVNVVSCNDTVVNVGDISVEVQGNRVLNDNEISILENNLNDADVDVLNSPDVNISIIKDVVIKTYKSFNPSIEITKNDINVCVASHCK